MQTQSLLGPGMLLLAALGCRGDVHSPTEPGSPSSPPELAIPSNTWITKADMPNSARWEAATAVVPNTAGQSILYVMGGRTATGSSLSRVQAYNAATNAWTWKAPLPVPLMESNGAGVINGKIYISGGDMSHRAYSNRLYQYDPGSNRWTRKRDLPTEGYHGFTGVIDNKLYVVTSCHGDFEWCGYWYEDHPDRWLFRYDPLTDAWTELAVPPRAFYWGVGGTTGKMLYLGHSGSRILDVYDPATNTWTQRSSTVAARAGAAFTTLGAKLYMMGGYRLNADGSGTEVRATNVYDPATNLWTNRAPMPTLRSWMMAGRLMVNDRARIAVVGGPRPGNNLQYVP